MITQTEGYDADEKIIKRFIPLYFNKQMKRNKTNNKTKISLRYTGLCVFKFTNTGYEKFSKKKEPDIITEFCYRYYYKYTFFVIEIKQNKKYIYKIWIR